MFLELLKYTEDKYEEYGVEYDFAELDSYLAGLDKENAIQLTVIPYVSLGDDENWANYEEQLKNWIGDATTTDTDEVAKLFERLKEVDEIIGSAKDMFDDKRLDTAWCEIADSDNPFKYDLLAMRIARGNAFTSSYRLHYNEADTAFRLRNVHVMLFPKGRGVGEKRVICGRKKCKKRWSWGCKLQRFSVI